MGELVEYLVLTECGRRLAWSALGLDQLYRDMDERNYKVKVAVTMEEYDKAELKYPA